MVVVVPGRSTRIQSSNFIEFAVERVAFHEQLFRQPTSLPSRGGKHEISTASSISSSGIGYSFVLYSAISAPLNLFPLSPFVEFSILAFTSFALRQTVHRTFEAEVL